MSYFLTICTPENATGQLRETYKMLESMFQMVPKIFIAQSMRPDLLEPVVTYVNRLLIETRALPRASKELIAAYVSSLNRCEYWVDAHSAMAMAQGYSREDVKNILDNVAETTLIDEKTRSLLMLAGKITRHSYRVTADDVERLKGTGCSEEEIYEAVAVTSLFNFLDRMADALGAPVEGFKDMVEQMQKS